jgi:hypothetical protein
MRNRKPLWIIMSLVFIITGCKYPTLETAVSKAIPFEVKEILYEKKSQGTTILLYTHKAEDEDGEPIKEPVLGMAFLEGNNKDGWENDGPNGWDTSENTNYSIFQQNYTHYGKKGEVLKDIDVVFGEILNGDIDKVEFAKQDSEEYKNAKIIKKGKKRYYIGIGDQPKIRALNANGEVVQP